MTPAASALEVEILGERGFFKARARPAVQVADPVFFRPSHSFTMYLLGYTEKLSR